MPTKILVVDDEADLELLITLKFRKEIRSKQMTFRFANNGIQALAVMAAETDVDLVLTDINMPQMDGLTLLSKLREARPGLQTIVLSAYGDMASIRAAMNRGAHDFLTKPIDFNDLRITVRKAIEYCEERYRMQQAEIAQGKAEKEAMVQEQRANKAQQQLIEHLKKMDKLKDEFLANTSHELRTPLNGIIGIVESLMDGATGTLRPETLGNLAMVAASGKRLARLVDDILDFSIMKSGDVELHPEPVDLPTTVAAILLMCAPLLDSKPIVLINEIPARSTAVLVDRNRLEQVFFNLIGNAVKFTEAGEVRISCKEANGQMAITVSDTGIGIPEHKFEDIFRSFEQVELANTRRHSGAGLGLSITRSLLEQSGGKITVASQLGVGSQFTFLLPTTEARPEGQLEWSANDSALLHMKMLEESTQTKDLDTGPVKDGARILIVDDEPINRQALANYLNIQNYQVTLAVDGASALQLVEEEPDFDLIILDVMMPGMSGFEVCQILREKHSLFELPILLLTARGQPQDFVKGLELGANDYLTKPFDKRILLARVNTLVCLRDAVGQTLAGERNLHEQRYRNITLETEKTALADKAREAVRAEAHAREVSRQKTNFLALMSHELRTPLNAIIGYSEILHEDMELESLDRHVPDIQKIKTSARNLLNMINHLLDLTKIEAGKMELYLEEFRLSLLFDEVRLTIDPLLVAKGNTLHINRQPGLEIMRADVTKLRQILLNLLGNSCKFTHKGTISLDASLYGNSEMAGVKLVISDTGIGMSAEQLGRLFQPFAQAEKSTARNYGGTGLGLIITEKFCRMLGGHIDVKSELGKGAVFTITLPQDNLSSKD